MLVGLKTTREGLDRVLGVTVGGTVKKGEEPREGRTRRRRRELGRPAGWESCRAASGVGLAWAGSSGEEEGEVRAASISALLITCSSSSPAAAGLSTVPD